MPIPDPNTPYVSVDPDYVKDMRIASLKTDINRLECRANAHVEWMDKLSGRIAELEKKRGVRPMGYPHHLRKALRPEDV